MKKLLLFAAALFAVSTINAQVTAYVGYSSIKSSKTIKNVPGTATGTVNGFIIQGDYNISLSDEFGVAPGLGLNFAFGDDDYKGIKAYIPIDFNYGVSVSDDIKLSAFVGPTLALGLSSKSKLGGVEVNYYDDDNISRFDILLGFGCWLTFQEKYRLAFAYRMGMLDQNKTDVTTTKENLLTLTLGYTF